MNAKQYEISTRSRYSWTNLHEHNFVSCRKCNAPMTPVEFGPAVGDLSKIVTARLPDRCTDCANAKALAKTKKKEEKELSNE